MQDYIIYIIDTVVSLLIGGGIGFKIGNKRVNQKNMHIYDSNIKQAGRDQINNS